MVSESFTHSPPRKTGTSRSACPFGAGGSDPISIEATRELKIGDQRAIEFLAKQAKFDPVDIKNAKALLDRLDPALINLFLVDSIFAMSRMPQVTADFGALADHAKNAGTRFEHTKRFFLEMIEKVDSPGAIASIHRVNVIHHHLGVSPTDPQFGYVLFCLTRRFIESVRRFDNTSPTAEEEHSWYNIWREVGRLMGADLPKNYQDFIAQNHALEHKMWQVPNPIAHEVAQKMISIGSNKIPPALQSLGIRWMLTLSDSRVLDSLGLPQPAIIERVVVQSALRLLGVAKDAIAMLHQCPAAATKSTPGADSRCPF